MIYILLLFKGVATSSQKRKNSLKNSVQRNQAFVSSGEDTFVGASGSGEGFSSASDSSEISISKVSKTHYTKLKTSTVKGKFSGDGKTKTNSHATFKQKARSHLESLSKDMLKKGRRQDIDKTITNLDNLQGSYAKGENMDLDNGLNQLSDFDKGTLDDYFNALNGHKEEKKTNKPPPADVFVGPETQFPDDSEEDPFYDAIDKGKTLPKVEQEQINPSIKQESYTNDAMNKEMPLAKQNQEDLKDKEEQEQENESYEDEETHRENEHDYGSQNNEDDVELFQFGPIEHNAVGQPLDNTKKQHNNGGNNKNKIDSNLENNSSVVLSKSDGETITNYEPTSGPTTSRDNTNDGIYVTEDKGENPIVKKPLKDPKPQPFSSSYFPITPVGNSVTSNSQFHSQNSPDSSPLEHHFGNNVTKAKNVFYSDQSPESESFDTKQDLFQPVFAEEEQKPSQSQTGVLMPLKETKGGFIFNSTVKNSKKLSSAVSMIPKHESNEKVSPTLLFGSNGTFSKISNKNMEKIVKENNYLSQMKGTRIVGGKISGGVISGGYITGGDIKAGSVEGGIIAGGRMEGGRIKNGTLEGGIFHDGLLEGGHVLNGTIEGGNIKSGNVMGGKIRGGSVEGGNVKGGLMLGGKLKGGSLEGVVFKGGYFKGGSIKGGKMTGGTLTGGEIVGGNLLHGKISGGHLKSGYVLGGEMKNGSIEGGVLKGGSVEGGVLKGGVMEGGKLKGGVVLNGKIKGGVIEGGIIEGGEIGEGVIIKSGVVNGTITVVHSHHKKPKAATMHQSKGNQSSLGPLAHQDIVANDTKFLGQDKQHNSITPNIGSENLTYTPTTNPKQQLKIQSQPWDSSLFTPNNFNPNRANFLYNKNNYPIPYGLLQQNSGPEQGSHQFQQSVFQTPPFLQNTANRNENDLPFKKSSETSDSNDIQNDRTIPSDQVSKFNPTTPRSTIRKLIDSFTTVKGKLNHEKGKNF